MKRENKKLRAELTKEFWWRPSLSGDELGQAVAAQAQEVQRNQQWRTEENVLNLGFYRGVELSTGLTGPGLSLGRFSPTNRGALAVGDGVVRNVVRSVSDGALNKIASRKPKPTFVVDGGDGSQARQARTMDKLVRGVFNAERAYRKGRKALQSAIIFGTGAVKVVERTDRVGLEATLVDELYVDETEGYAGEPRTLYQVKPAPKEVLLALYPEAGRAVVDSPSVSVETGGAGRLETNHVAVYEAWHLPSAPGAGDGRHCIAVDEGLLVDEEWEQDSFPFVFMHWNQMPVGFWGEGIPSVLRGPQVYINRITRRVLEAIRKYGMPKLYLDVNTKVTESAKDREMNVVRFGGRQPTVESPRVLMGKEVYDYLDGLEQWCYRLTGVSEMDATGAKPPGLYSGEAIRQWSDQTSARFTEVVGFYEDMYVELGERVMEAGKRLAEREGSYRVRVSEGTFVEELDFRDVDLDRSRYFLKVLPTAFLPSTFSGKLETLEYLRQNSYIDFQTARDNLDMPDVVAALELAQAPVDALHRRLDTMLETLEYAPPDELDDLEAGIVLFTNSFHLVANRGGDDVDRKQDLLRRWIDAASQMLAAREPPPEQPQAPAPDVAGPGAQPAVKPGSILPS